MVYVVIDKLKQCYLCHEIFDTKAHYFCEYVHLFIEKNSISIPFLYKSNITLTFILLCYALYTHIYILQINIYMIIKYLYLYVLFAYII